MNKPNPKANFFFNKAKTWQKEFEKLRTIILNCGLTEEVKWGVACYTFQDNNILLIHGFKEYCAILFMKGVLLKDPKHILIQQTKNVQSARQIRFTSLKEITTLESTIKSYIREAIEIEKSGKKVAFKKASEFSVPEEFQQKLDDDHALKRAFEALTPGRQKGYLLYFSAAKQTKTREARIEKYIPQILDGLGLDD